MLGSQKILDEIKIYFKGLDASKTRLVDANG